MNPSNRIQSCLKSTNYLSCCPLQLYCFFGSLRLLRRLHIAYLLRGLERDLPSAFISLDASRPWICFWIVHSLDLLGYRLDEVLQQRVINTLIECQHPQGGFGGGPGQLAHLACTCAAISTLAILGTSIGYTAVDREGLLTFLLRMKQPNGAFAVHEDGEQDVRGSYCALVVASLLGFLQMDVATKLTENAAEFIRSCQTYEGGIGAVPFAEAHAGYTYCGVAALSLLDRLEILDLQSLDRFAVRSQCNESGGFRGRTHKLVDGCYSFWTGAIFPLMRRACPAAYFATLALQKYILVAAQNEISGGLRDKPGKAEDYYHTCYCLSGLAIAQRESPDFSEESPLEGGIVLGDPSNLLPIILPEYNLRPEQVQDIKKTFCSHSQ